MDIDISRILRRVKAKRASRVNKVSGVLISLLQAATGKLQFGANSRIQGKTHVTKHIKIQFLTKIQLLKNR